MPPLETSSLSTLTRHGDSTSAWNSSNRAHWSPHRASNSSNRAHWASEIGSIRSELSTPTLGLESFLISTCCRGPRRRPSSLPQGILHFTSLSFSLLIFGFCCGLWSKRESSFSLNWVTEMRLSLSLILSLSFWTVIANWLQLYFIT